VAAVAGRQHGVISRRQCLGAGLTAQMIDRRVATGRLFLLHRGVYAVGHPGLTFEGRCMAGVLATGGHASHRTAAALWRLRARDARLIDVVVRTRGSLRPGLHVHRTRCLTDRDVTYRDRIPVTNLRRTLLDLADVTTPTTFENSLRAAERIHGFDRAVLGGIRGRRGTKTIRAHRPVVLGHLEPRFLEIVREAGLPLPETNVTFGPYVLDALWRQAGVVVEIDDWETHRTRHAFRRDRAKGNAIVAAGFVLLRFTADDLDHPADVVRRLRHALSRSS
jgi:hypothetical protein